MLIPCPHCGQRDVSEFTYLGDAKIKRPIPEKAKQVDWENFVYNRDNPLGEHLEHWHHTGGCRLILELKRNTKTHEIRGAKACGAHTKKPPAKKPVKAKEAKA